MKFSEYLWKHLTPEWYSQYIQYDQMKTMLNNYIEKSKELSHINNESLREQFFLNADEEFFPVIYLFLIEFIFTFSFFIKVLYQRIFKNEHILC